MARCKTDEQFAEEVRDNLAQLGEKVTKEDVLAECARVRAEMEPFKEGYSAVASAQGRVKKFLSDWKLPWVDFYVCTSIDERNAVTDARKEKNLCVPPKNYDIAPIRDEAIENLKRDLKNAFDVYIAVFALLVITGLRHCSIIGHPKQEVLPEFWIEDGKLWIEYLGKKKKGSPPFAIPAIHDDYQRIVDLVDMVRNNKFLKMSTIHAKIGKYMRYCPQLWAYKQVHDEYTPDKPFTPHKIRNIFAAWHIFLRKPSREKAQQLASIVLGHNPGSNSGEYYLMVKHVPSGDAAHDSDSDFGPINTESEEEDEQQDEEQEEEQEEEGGEEEEAYNGYFDPVSKPSPKRAREEVEAYEPAKRTRFESAVICIAKTGGSPEQKWNAVMQQLLELL